MPFISIISWCSGYAADPSVEVDTDQKLIGNVEAAETSNTLTVFEAAKKRPGDKRKRDSNYNAGDIENFTGPWAKYKDEETVSKPSEVNKLLYIAVNLPFKT